MEYSKILPQQDDFFNFWNIEYSTENVNKKIIEFGGMWNIRGIFLKIVKQSKYPKFWNNSRNIPIIVKQGTGA